MEFLKFNQLGQWTLFKNWTPQQKHSMVFDWGEAGDPSVKENTPAASGRLRSSMLNHLDKRTQFRINPDTNEKEYRLFRAATTKDNRHAANRTSWSTDPGFCLYWASTQRPAPNEPLSQEHVEHGKNWRIMAAWVPEKHIHSFLPPIQRQLKSDKEEGEAVVEPHKVKIDRVVQGAELNNAIAHAEKHQKYRNDYIK